MNAYECVEVCLVVICQLVQTLILSDIYGYVRHIAERTK